VAVHMAGEIVLTNARPCDLNVEIERAGSVSPSHYRTAVAQHVLNRPLSNREIHLIASGSLSNGAHSFATVLGHDQVAAFVRPPRPDHQFRRRHRDPARRRRDPRPGYRGPVAQSSRAKYQRVPDTEEEGAERIVAVLTEANGEVAQAMKDTPTN